MDTLNEMVRSSTLLRLLSALFLFGALIAALVVGTIELIQGKVPNQYVVLIVGAGIGHGMSLLNINYGVLLTPSKSQQNSNTKQLPPPQI